MRAYTQPNTATSDWIETATALFSRNDNLSHTNSSLRKTRLAQNWQKEIIVTIKHVHYTITFIKNSALWCIGIDVALVVNASKDAHKYEASWSGN